MDMREGLLLCGHFYDRGSPTKQWLGSPDNGLEVFQPRISKVTPHVYNDMSPIPSPYHGDFALGPLTQNERQLNVNLIWSKAHLIQFVGIEKSIHVQHISDISRSWNYTLVNSYRQYRGSIFRFLNHYVHNCSRQTYMYAICVSNYKTFVTIHRSTAVSYTHLTLPTIYSV